VVENLLSSITEPIVKRFEEKISYFRNFVALDTGPEEWFRVEILDVLVDIEGLDVLATNQKFEGFPGRPDFVIKHNNKNYIVELKVLPTDSNYGTGYQRFCGGKTNKADFDGLVNDEVDLIIYIHWPSSDDFSKTKENLKKRYGATPLKEKTIRFDDRVCTITFWGKNV